ncbi:MAG: NTP transferase domain-containing protein [Neorhizobium sp.]|nr:NTP transferase domain-containing protein [Neorhizobium sp.]
MIFGDFPIESAAGVVLAHAVQCGGLRFSKGARLTADDVCALGEAGQRQVTGMRLEAGDVAEDEAAATIAGAIPAAHLRLSEASTGRVNVYAQTSGLFVADRAVVDALNRVDPAITLACLADHVAVRAGDMVATIKIIPLAVAGEKMRLAADRLRESAPFSVKPFRAHAVTLIATELPSLKPSVMDKTARLLAQRLSISNSRLTSEIRVPHDRQALTQAFQTVAAPENDEPAMIIVFGASAVADSHDVIPAAIEAAGGEVMQVGMPVDPGNLMVLGRLGHCPVIGAPGCARSPKDNGFDWILHRLMAGETPTTFDITGLGVGGLLMEIPTRPKPRESKRAETLNIGAILLAAGQARRMGEGGQHKLLAEFDGKPLVRRSAERMLAAGFSPSVVVTGHRQAEIEEALAGLRLDCRFNPDYASGMAGSVIAGLQGEDIFSCDGVLIMLADMPAVTIDNLTTLANAFAEAGGRCVVRSVSQGKRGNPVILPRSVFDAVMRLEGDVGARAIIENSGLPVIDVDIGAAAHIDVDTPDAVVAAGGILRD